MADDLTSAVTSVYPTEEFPTLWWQHRQWAEERPLAGLRVLDATPVFGNTLAKYLALTAAGADVTVGVNPILPSDAKVVAALPSLGIPVTWAPQPQFDVVLDCAGLHAQVPAAYGYTELTRSGVARYADAEQPVFVADSGVIKRIETTLGTSDGFIRAMAQLGHPIPPDAHVVIFGLGKVGAGVAHAARRCGARITAIDPRRTPAGATPGATEELREVAAEGRPTIDPADSDAVLEALDSAWCVVAATGVESGLDPYAHALVNSPALLANMGAEDEFGPRVPAERALNGKLAVNFALAEPTLLRYMDATMALSNAGAIELVAGRCKPGLNVPPPALEAELLRITREYGLIGDELDTLHTGDGVTY